MLEKDLNKVLNYMKQYVENKYEHDSEPMLNYKDLQIVLSYIEQLKKENEQLKSNRDKAIELYENDDYSTLADDMYEIIKEVREYITYWHYRNDFRINSFTTGVKEELLEILDKERESE